MIQEISVHQLKAKIDAGGTFRLIDVRSPAEFASGHVPGTVNIPLETIQSTLAGVDSNEEVVMICQRGGRSMNACKKVSATYPLLVNVAGGTGDWIAAGFPVVS